MKQTILMATLLLLAAGGAQAQAGADCPTLPADAGVEWEKLDGADYTFCKAIRASDGEQVLAVMIATEAPFRPRRGDRTRETVIDGHEAWWYRGQLSGNAGTEVRETLLELDRKLVAHISLRAGSEEQLAQAMTLAESLRFDDVRLSIN